MCILLTKQIIRSTLPYNTRAVNAGRPVIGAAVEDEIRGTPVDAWQKPEGPAEQPCSLQASDDFADGFGLQRQFMGNWQADFFTAENGCLRLNVQRADDRLWDFPRC